MPMRDGTTESRLPLVPLMQILGSCHTLFELLRKPAPGLDPVCGHWSGVASNPEPVDTALQSAHCSLVKAG